MDSVQQLARDQSLNLIIIFRVDKNISKNRFVLYYQELEGDNHLRKIKLNMEDISEIKDVKSLNFGDSLKFNYKDEKENIIFDDFSLEDSVSYKTRLCNSNSCEDGYHEYAAKSNEKIIYLSYSSVELDGKNMIDFSNNYSKIKYIDNNGVEKIIDFQTAVTDKYYGKYLYIKVPKELEDAKEISMIYTIRNKRYTYNLKKESNYE